MSLGQVDKDISQTAPGKDLDSVWWFAVRELAEVVRKLRTRWNAFANDIDTNASFTFGGVTFRVVSGAPTQPDPEGSYAFRIDVGRPLNIYTMIGGVWAPIA